MKSHHELVGLHGKHSSWQAILRGPNRAMPPKAQPVALRIELQDIEPLIWRRIIVPNHWTLASLHHYVQWVMGWTDTHAHEFHVKERVLAPAWWIQEVELDMPTANYLDERRFSVAAAANELGMGGEFEYRYDMGDGWRHRLVVEAVPVAWSGSDLPLPACSAGENACPPEDVGGPPGYEHFLAVIGDPSCEEFDDTLRWIGGPFDPKGFDLNRINREWRGARRRRSR
jgi:hypothetical protein